MTKKHFVAIANIIKSNSEGEDLRQVAEEMADFFLSINPRFNRETFLTACGL